MPRSAAVTELSGTPIRRQSHCEAAAFRSRLVKKLPSEAVVRPGIPGRAGAAPERLWAITNGAHLTDNGIISRPN